MFSKAHPLGHFIKLFIKDIDENPRIQLKIHKLGFWYWTINFPIISYLFFFQPGYWLKYGLFITLIYSIYANWTSDYTGMSSSQSVINTEKLPENPPVLNQFDVQTLVGEQDYGR